MLNSIIQLLLRLLFFIINFISLVVLSPILNFISLIFPDFSSYQATFTEFYTYYLIPGIKIALSVFYNITGFPPALFQLLVTVWLAKITVFALLKPIVFLLNVWKLIRTGSSNSSAKKQSS